METVLPLLNKILENNQLVKGRLRVSQSELEKLYQSLENNTDQLKKKLHHQEELIRSQIRKRNRIKFQLKRNLESINKTFHPSKKNISLLFKKQGESSYIKARLYWGGRQREVQVGSIAIVLKMINNMISKGILSDLIKIRAKKITWKQIKQKPELIEAIKTIAAFKFQEYIIRQLLAGKINKIDSNIQDGKRVEKSLLVEEEIEKIHSEHESADTSHNAPVEKVDWYIQWRRNNL
jgi:septal ring factor EnvC (AmiA/AmiB activator)